ncbi:YicC/YloC family endoribonuclease [Pelagibius sp. 7325]|uniref:YicC/YloC family endoribonuclease n=1 Tax=Pelagibius sp. 7325 TaxID=3131994 RepID=UPI0030EC5E54
MSKSGKVVHSMTGFARRDGGDATVSWTWEVKSVNGRSLDVRARLPQGYESLDPIVRSAVTAACSRGNLQVNLSMKRGSAPLQLQVNEDLLQQVIDLMARLESRTQAAPPRLDGILGLRGVLEAVEEEESPEDQEVRLAALREDLDAALQALLAMRAAEGARLLGMARGHLDEIERLAKAARSCAATQPETLRQRLKEQLAVLVEESTGVAEERLAQELAILAGKADVREELDRLAAHVEAARELLDQGGAVGRKLDFLCQEFNREANTLCSKSADVELTRIGLDLKSSIEQLREQIQNIE